LSNVSSAPAGTSYTQHIALNGSGTTTPPPPPPPAVVPVLDNETIHVTDAEAFPDVFDPEPIKVADQVRSSSEYDHHFDQHWWWQCLWHSK